MTTFDILLIISSRLLKTDNVTDISLQGFLLSVLNIIIVLLSLPLSLPVVSVVVGWPDPGSGEAAAMLAVSYSELQWATAVAARSSKSSCEPSKPDKPDSDAASLVSTDNVMQ